jgi:hypothetical protein
VRHVIADLNELRYVSSMGLRVFVRAAQALQARSGSLRTPGGLGIFLVRGIAESLVYGREGERNVLSFIFAGAGATTAAPPSFNQ